MASLRAQHPGWERHLCLADRIDGRFDPSELGAALCLAEELPLGADWGARYSVFEACCALKPLMAQRLLAAGYQRVVYLDADIELYGPLDCLDQAFSRGAFLQLSPHRLGPCADQTSERALLRAGAFNAGFLALSAGGRADAFLAWWRRCLLEDCVNDQDHGRFVDQRWLDQAPAAFEGVHVLRHPGCNVGHWNLDERALTLDGGAWRAAGEPLLFFHFSGFEGDPSRLSKHAPGRDAGSPPALAPLLQGYARRLDLAGEAEARRLDCRLGAAAHGSDWPFWLAWLPPYRLWRRRPDLWLSIAQPRGRDAKRLWAWYLRHGLRESLQLQLARVPGLRMGWRRCLAAALRLRASLGPKPALQPGLDLVGYFRSENGVGEACRLTAEALQADGLPFSGIDLSQVAPSANRLSADQAWMAPRALRRVALLHINGSILPSLPRLAAGKGLFRGQRRIGVWHWELPVLPASQAEGLPFIDELWAPSRFIEACLRDAAPARVPVLHLPYAILPDPDPDLTRRDFGLPEDRLLVSAFFDAHSIPQRKNPLGALRAFQRAFRPDDTRVFLSLKANQGMVRPEALAELRALAEGWPNIRLWDATLSRRATHRLIQLSDAVLSLHRSEGFGLVMAEAMALGRLAIATGWSGNMDFMRPENSAVVRHRLQPVGADFGPYEAWQTWAEPDEAHAAELLQRFVEDRAWAQGLAAQGQHDVRAAYAPAVAGARIRERLQTLGAL